MKKIILTLLATVALCATAQAQEHVEFRWHGLYVTGDVAYAMNLNRAVDEFGVVGDTLSAIIPSITVGYSIRKEACVGLGFSYVADPTGAYTQLPLFLELRSHYTRAQLTPYSVFQVGYTLPLGSSSEAKPVSNEIEEGGLYLGLEGGVRYAFTRHVAAAAHLGYRFFQSNSLHRRDANGNSIIACPISLHCLTAGLTFYFSN